MVNTASKECHEDEPACCADTALVVETLVEHACQTYCVFLLHSFHDNMRKCAVTWPTDLCGAEPPTGLASRGGAAEPSARGDA